jgi:hypothetical protein
VQFKVKYLIFNKVLNWKFSGKSKGMAGGKRGNARVKRSVLWHLGTCKGYPPAMRLLRGAIGG